MYILLKYILSISASSVLFSACSSNSTAHNSPRTNSLYKTYEGCVIKGGDVQESFPSICSIGNEVYEQDISTGKTGDKKRVLFEVAPQTRKCQGFHPVWQDCLIVNGDNFFEEIIGYRHKPGLGALLEIERTQICDPQSGYLNPRATPCPADIEIYDYRLIRILNENVKHLEHGGMNTFVGQITNIEPGGDGYTVQLTNNQTSEVLFAVISIPNLGPDSRFDFDHVRIGNTLEVSGEKFKLGDRNQMAARTVRLVPY